MSRLDDLLAAILARPEDDELRKVYGDALQEHGHPHGELIALQFQRLAGVATPEMRERERVLLANHAADVLGPLMPAVSAFEIERGFLRKCVVYGSRIGDLVGHPRWATVEDFRGPPSIYLHPVMRSLRVLRLAHLEDVAGVDELCGGTVQRGIEQLELPDYFQIPDVVLASPALPRLAVLGSDAVRDPSVLGRFAGAPIVGRLSRLELGAQRGTITSWYEAIARVRPAPTVVLRGVSIGSFVARCELARDYTAAHLTLHHRAHEPESLDLLAALAEHVRELSVVVKHRSLRAWNTTYVLALRSIVERFERSSFDIEDEG